MQEETLLHCCSYLQQNTWSISGGNSQLYILAPSEKMEGGSASGKGRPSSARPGSARVRPPSVISQTASVSTGLCACELCCDCMTYVVHVPA